MYVRIHDCAMSFPTAVPSSRFLDRIPNARIRHYASLAIMRPFCYVPCLPSALFSPVSSFEHDSILTPQTVAIASDVRAHHFIDTIVGYRRQQVKTRQFLLQRLRALGAREYAATTTDQQDYLACQPSREECLVLPYLWPDRHRQQCSRECLKAHGPG
jgi:hypothetical protein